MNEQAQSWVYQDTNGEGTPQKNVNNNIPEEQLFAQNTTQPCTNHHPVHAKYAQQKEQPQHSQPSRDVKMETDDIIRAGGFGARDGLSSVLPIASDSTDFESSLLDMRQYEEPQADTHRPGLGWSQDNESK